MITIEHLVKVPLKTAVEILNSYDDQALNRELCSKVTELYRSLESGLLAYKKLNPRSKRRVGRRIHMVQRFLAYSCRRERDFDEFLKRGVENPMDETKMIDTNFSYGQQQYMGHMGGYGYGWS